MRSNLSGALLLVVICGCGLVASETPGKANPLIAEQTALPCASCHQPGRELEGGYGPQPGWSSVSCRLARPMQF
jgi:hypothetical protein